MRRSCLPLVLSCALAALAPGAATAQVNFGVGVHLPGITIGINVPAYPNLVLIPGYPVYYDPRVDGNYFFYDGVYWTFNGDGWYSSSWYNGPWQAVPPDAVPLYLLRVPVRYFRHPPPYFRGWRADGPPRWGEHWGRDWAEHHRGWDHWDRRSAPPPAPLPSYQRDFHGERYPGRPEQQDSIRAERYRYQPQEQISQRHFQAPQGEGERGRGPEAQPERGGRGEDRRPQGRERDRPEGERRD